ncbi:enoyl-CoA hydratase [bacterium]|nr:MAG: enoyl-CoA hydratase [bacterium]
MADIEYSVKDRIATIRLNRPAKKNAFTLDMIDRWSEFLINAKNDSTVRAVLVTGAGDAFCSGVDLDDLGDFDRRPLTWKSLLADHIYKVVYAMDDMDKVVVAAVNGIAVGAGMDMALMCDVRYAARSARFSEGYIRIGLVPGDGGCYFLPRLAGPAAALELLLTGDFIDASQAERFGIVNHVVDDDALLETALEFVTKVARHSPLATRMIKRAVYQSLRGDLRTSLDLISSHMAVVQSTDDAKEALDAFRQRREPHFEGR